MSEYRTKNQMKQHLLNAADYYTDWSDVPQDDKDYIYSLFLETGEGRYYLSDMMSGEGSNGLKLLESLSQALVMQCIHSDLESEPVRVAFSDLMEDSLYSTMEDMFEWALAENLNELQLGIA